MLVKTYAGALYGIHATLITIEVSAGGPIPEGRPGYHLVGLPDNAVREGYYRIGAAIKSLKLRLPRIRIVINMAPADQKKEGSFYDLPLAIGMLCATKQIQSDIVFVDIDPANGLLANQRCANRKSVPFIRGRQPDDFAPCSGLAQQLKSWFNFQIGSGSKSNSTSKPSTTPVEEKNN